MSSPVVNNNQSQGQPTYEPINGLEGRKLLKRDINEKIDKLPLMNGGNSFHRFHAIYSLIITAYPVDCPVPTAEYEFARNAPEFDQNLHYIEGKTKSDELKTLKQNLLNHIEKIDKVLEVISPEVEIEGDLSAGDIPDELRTEHGLPVPKIVTSTNMNTGASHKSVVYQSISDAVKASGVK